jgi:hypothetical protein
MSHLIYASSDLCQTETTATPGLAPGAARLEVPLNRPPQAFFEIGGRSETEFALAARDVQVAARLPVGLAWIPYDLAMKAGQPRDQPGQVANGYLAGRLPG